MYYNDSLLKLTNVIYLTEGYNVWTNGFQNIDKHVEYDWVFYKGENYKLKYYIIPKIDTINSTKWFYAQQPTNGIDSSVLMKKIEYSFILFNLKERRLNEDTIKKVRILLPSDNISAQGEWTVVKLLLYQDSTTCLKKAYTISDTSRSNIVKTHSKKISRNKQKSLIKELKILEGYKGYECFQDNYYPILLEYYDGSIERTFIISNRCKEDKKLIHTYENVIRYIWNYK